LIFDVHSLTLSIINTADEDPSLSFLLAQGEGKFKTKSKPKPKPKARPKPKKRNKAKASPSIFDEEADETGMQAFGSPGSSVSR
jgi:hypothetical protein